MNEHRKLNLLGLSLDLLNLLIELTETSFFRTLNELKRVHLLVIKLEQTTFNFELRT